jgi:hypothetical protein
MSFHDPINSLVNEVKSDAGFLSKLLFPKISLIIGLVGVLVVIVVLLK